MDVQRLGHTIHANLSFIFQVTLVSDDDNREGILVLDSEDLLVECADFLKRITRCDRIDEEEAFTRAHVLLPHGAGGDIS